MSDEAVLRFTVGEADTAAALGSGDVAVLGTPRLLAWAEAATVAALGLTGDETSVGTRVSLEHLRPSGVGQVLEVRARLVHRDGRLCRFEVSAAHHDGVQVGHGEVTRVVVGRERFLSRL